MTHGDAIPQFGRDTLVAQAVNVLNLHYLALEQDPKSAFAVLRITAPEPLFAKQLAEVVLDELESLNRYFKKETVSDKTNFIENRIFSVEKELLQSENL